MYRDLHPRDESNAPYQAGLVLFITKSRYASYSILLSFVNTNPGIFKAYLAFKLHWQLKFLRNVHANNYNPKGDLTGSVEVVEMCRHGTLGI